MLEVLDVVKSWGGVERVFASLVRWGRGGDGAGCGERCLRRNVRCESFSTHFITLKHSFSKSKRFYRIKPQSQPPKHLQKQLIYTKTLPISICTQYPSISVRQIILRLLNPRSLPLIAITRLIKTPRMVTFFRQRTPEPRFAAIERQIRVHSRLTVFNN